MGEHLDQVLVTVVTANFNGSRYLAQAIESVRAQTHANIEYVIVDDGSTDGSRDLIEDYCRKDPRIKAFLLPENQGVARARNTGIENSHGKYVTFLDSDDEWMPNKLEKQLELFRRHPRAGLVVTGAAVIDRDGHTVEIQKQRKKPMQGAVSLYDYIAGKCLLSINAMTRRECLEKSGLFNPNYVIGEDYELWMRITRDYEYYYLEEPLHRYRVHGDNATRDKLFNRESKIRILEEKVANNPDLLDELGRGFKHIMQRKYNSLGKAYFKANRLSEADTCFRKASQLRSSLAQTIKARVWQLALKSRQRGAI
ncbi:glycosyltransferase family 2 protein [Gilvimarinus sp. F26214L]|uniref:glycosyltransferase family 2 protein n=1 Tax=Gilvimarinus sp. DZF01 TaxID=3461371 RepID=UPI0040465AFD